MLDLKKKINIKSKDYTFLLNLLVSDMLRDFFVMTSKLKSKLYISSK